MRDFHVIQLDGTRCAGRNCACASTAMAVAFGTRGKYTPSAATVRLRSGISCTPGVDTRSGGITIDAVKRVCKIYGVTINYNGGSSSIRRWTAAEGKARLSTKYGAIFLGDYDQLKWPWRANTSFRGDHSAWAHDYREDMADSHYGKVQPTVCWHDPLRAKPIRIPWTVLVAYWQKAGSPIRGFAGFVYIPVPAGCTFARPLLDRTRTAYASVPVYSAPGGKIVGSIRPKGKLVQIAMYKKSTYPFGSGGDRYLWGAISLLGNRWVQLGRLSNTHGST